MKVLVTGASGFLGGHLLPALSEAGHDVRALVRRDLDLGVEMARGDVTEPDTLTPAMEGIDVVIHAAGSVGHRPEAASHMQAVHVGGTKNVIEASRAAGVGRVVHISSSGTVAVSDKDEVLDETAPDPLRIVGTWSYYRAKLFAERVAREAQGIDVVCLNPSLLLGPGDEGDATRPVRLLLEGWIPAAPCGGLSFVDVRDVAAQAARCVTEGTPGERYLLGAANWSWREFYERLARISGEPAPRMTMPRATRKVLDFFPKLGKEDGIGLFRKKLGRHEVELTSHFWYLDDTKARQQLGWQSRDPVQTLADTVEDLRGAPRCSA